MRRASACRCMARSPSPARATAPTAPACWALPEKPPTPSSPTRVEAVLAGDGGTQAGEACQWPACRLRSGEGRDLRLWPGPARPRQWHDLHALGQDRRKSSSARPIIRSAAASCRPRPNGWQSMAQSREAAKPKLAVPYPFSHRRARCWRWGKRSGLTIAADEARQ